MPDDHMMHRSSINMGRQGLMGESHGLSCLGNTLIKVAIAPVLDCRPDLFRTLSVLQVREVKDAYERNIS